MKHNYEIKDENGTVHYSTSCSDQAIGFYAAIKNKYGYAEVWYNGAIIFKTK